MRYLEELLKKHEEPQRQGGALQLAQRRKRSQGWGRGGVPVKVTLRPLQALGSVYYNTVNAQHVI